MIQLLILRNTETLLNLVNMGILPPEAQPPQNLIGNPTSIFTSWFNSLSNPIKKEVLSHVPECNLEEQFLKVSKNRWMSPRVPSKPFVKQKFQLLLAPEKKNPRITRISCNLGNAKNYSLQNALLWVILGGIGFPCQRVSLEIWFSQWHRGLRTFSGKIGYLSVLFVVFVKFKDTLTPALSPLHRLRRAQTLLSWPSLKPCLSFLGLSSGPSCSS